ncbi:VanZ family protein [Sporosarcina sp. ACRSL]|uniref:VanZ family protein n=1 Tax=Sporosarcina sp. ACRSL TaxID=2918215 RepID=UPI001EF64A2F|nr:VanZ family protein [Sporosarcina sp. ACRSL]MCG7343979.1 VanZ family protein [Sporosarcina sp. ACRSL]
MRKILLLLVIVGVLFFSSGQTYEQQSIIPTLEEWFPGKPLENQLAKLQIPYWGKIISVEERGYYAFIEFLIRKAAHFFIFGLLAIAVYSILPKIHYRTIVALLITLLLAIGDEYHQSLTGGRTATREDVFLDMWGAFTFLLVFRLIKIALDRRRQNKKPRMRT